MESLGASHFSVGNNDITSKSIHFSYFADGRQHHITSSFVFKSKDFNFTGIIRADTGIQTLLSQT
jgi:hypothetical protein